MLGAPSSIGNWRGRRRRRRRRTRSVSVYATETGHFERASERANDARLPRRKKKASLFSSRFVLRECIHMSTKAVGNGLAACQNNFIYRKSALPCVAKMKKKKGAKRYSMQMTLVKRTSSFNKRAKQKKAYRRLRRKKIARVGEWISNRFNGFFFLAPQQHVLTCRSMAMLIEKENSLGHCSRFLDKLLLHLLHS